MVENWERPKLIQIVDTETTSIYTKPTDIIQFTSIITDEHYECVIYRQNYFFYSPNMTPAQCDFFGFDMEYYKTHYIEDFASRVSDIETVLGYTNYEMYAYNSSFDHRVIQDNMLRGGMPLPQLTHVNVMKKRKKLEFALLELGITEEMIKERTLQIFGECNSFHDSRFDTVATLCLMKATNFHK